MVIEVHDPFTGTWTFDLLRSRLSVATPREWIQHIDVRRDRVTVREHIISADTSVTSVWVDAVFGGGAFPVHGSPLADAISYIRNDERTISGTATRGGKVSLNETIVVSPAGDTLTMTFTIVLNDRKAAAGSAVFSRAQAASSEQPVASSQ